MKKNHKILVGLAALTALVISACTNSPSPSSPSSSGESESSITSEPSSSIVPTSSDSSSSSQKDPEYEKPVISGVEDMGVYIIGKQRVAPTFNVGEATLKRNDEDPIPFASGEEINESGTYTLKVVNGDKCTSVTFMLKYEKPVVSGVEDDGVYEKPVTITFTCGTATLSKDGGEAKVFEKGSVVSEFGLYKLIVKNGDETVEINFTIQAETPKIDGVKDGGIYANKAVPTFNIGSATLSKDGGEAVDFESGEAITEAGQYKLVVTHGDKKAEASFEVYEHEIQKGAIESFTDIDSWTKQSEKGKIERKKDGADYYMEVTKESGFDFYMYKRVNVNFLQNKYLALDVEGLNGFVPDAGFQIELLNDNGGVWDVTKVSAADAILVTSGEAQHGGNRNIFYFKITDDKFAGKEIENVQVKIYIMWGGEKIVIPYSLNIVADEDMPLVVQGIKDKGIYSVEEKVKATFEVGEATLSKDGGTPVAYVSGTEITSGKGHYLLSVSKGTDNLNLEFDIVDPIFSGWACTSSTGAEVSIENGKLVFTNTNGSYSSVGRKITVNTVDHPTMKIMVNEDSTSRWVLKAKTSSMGANIAITPEEAKTGEVLIDLSLFDEFKDLEDEEVMFEFYVFNNNKLVIDEIMFDTPNPAFSGVVDGGIYTEVTPVVVRGSATISKDGGEAVTFVSGTTIKEKGHYELIGSLGDKELTINFDVTDEIFTNWVSTNGAVVSIHNGNLNIKSTAGYCDAYRNIDNDVSQNPILVIDFDESSTSQVLIKINNVSVGSQDVKKGVKTFDLRDYAGLAELKTLNVHIYVFGTDNMFTEIKSITFNSVKPTVSGVENGAIYSESVTPTFDIGTATLKKDSGEALPFTSGSLVEEAGSYVLTVVNGNQTTVVNFIIDYDSPSITGVKDGETYNVVVAPTYPEGCTATIVKDGGDALPYVSGTEITEDGVYTIKVSKAERADATATFTIALSTPSISDVEDDGVYINSVTPTFDLGVATLKKDSEDAVAYVSGTEITEQGHYVLTVNNGSKSAEVEFDLFEKEVHENSVVNFYDTKSFTSVDGSSSIKAIKDDDTAIVLYTKANGKDGKQSTRVAVDFSKGNYLVLEVEKYGTYVPDSGFSIELLDDVKWYHVVLKPSEAFITENFTGGNGRTGIRYVFEIDEATYTGSGKNPISWKEASFTNLRVNINIQYGADKTLVMDSFYQIDEGKLPIRIEGVEEGGIYASGVVATIPYGTATLSKDGGDEVSYTSGTAIIEAGHYVLKVINGEQNKTVEFDVLPESLVGWKSTNGVEISPVNGSLKFTSTAAYCDAFKTFDTTTSKTPFLIINFDESSTSQVQIKINGVSVGSQDVKKGVKTFDLRDYGELAELETLDVHIYVFGTNGEFTLINAFELSNSLPRTVVLGSEVASWSADANVSKQIVGDATSVVLTAPGYGCVSNTFTISADTYRFLVVDLSSDNNCTIKINGNNATTNAKTKTIIDLSNFDLVGDFESVKVQIYVFSDTVPATIKGIYGMTLEEYCVVETFDSTDGWTCTGGSISTDSGEFIWERSDLSKLSKNITVDMKTCGQVVVVEFTQAFDWTPDAGFGLSIIDKGSGGWPKVAKTWDGTNCTVTTLPNGMKHYVWRIDCSTPSESADWSDLNKALYFEFMIQYGQGVSKGLQLDSIYLEPVNE